MNMTMDAEFHGGPLDGQHRKVWDSNGVPFSFHHIYTRAKNMVLHWAYQWDRDHYECATMNPVTDRHDAAMREKPMFDDIHDYDDGTDDVEGVDPEARPTR